MLLQHSGLLCTIIHAFKIKTHLRAIHSIQASTYIWETFLNKLNKRKEKGLCKVLLTYSDTQQHSLPGTEFPGDYKGSMRIYVILYLECVSAQWAELHCSSLE